MMLVKILHLGTSWWSKAGSDPNDPYRYTKRAAYFNSTGVRCGKKVRHHWLLPGVVRFNGLGDFNPNFPNRAIGQTFECSDVTRARGWNRLLFQRKLGTSVAPHCYLVVISCERCGRFDFTSKEWRSRALVVLAVSELREQQEAMLLMKPGDWVRTDLGIWQLHVSEQWPNGADLELLSGAVAA